MKRSVGKEEVVFPCAVPDEVFVVLLRKAFARYETDEDDYLLLNRLKVLSKNMEKMIGAMMRDAESLPRMIEMATNDIVLLERHRNIKILKVGHHSLDTVKLLRNLTEFTYFADEDPPSKNPFLSSYIETMTIRNRDYSKLPVEALQSVTKIILTLYSPVYSSVLSKFPNLTSLDLTCNVYIRDQDIQNLPCLIKLSIMVNESLTNNAFRFSSNLKHLDMSYQKTITDDALILYLTQLEYLHCNSLITSNGLSRLTNLKSLFLQIANDQFSFSHLTNLTELFPANAYPENDSWDSLPQSLTYLDLSCSFTKTTDRNLTRLTNLKTLYLHNNASIKHNTEIDIEGSLLMPSLKTLGLRGNSTIVDENIVNLTSLTFLDLYNNSTITHRALVNLTNLRNLILSEGIHYHHLTHLRSLTDISIPRHVSYIKKEDFPPYIYVNCDF